MTVSSSTRRNTYSGDGSTTVFPYTFRILNDADIVFQIKNDSTGAITTKTLTTHYTVSGAGDSGGGNVTTTVGNTPATGETIIITSSLAYTQPTDYNEYDTFPASSHENALDRATILVQQQKEITDRCLKLDPSNASFDATFPDPEAGKVVRINNDGDAFEFVTLADLGDYSIATGNGLLAQTATDSATPRTLTGTANEITVTNGTGASGNPTISLPTSLTFTGKTVTDGTFNNPTLTSAQLGTPDSGTLTNCTDLPVSTGVSGLGTGIKEALAVNIGSAGAPVLVNGVLGTPSSGTLTNCTGLPLTAGITGTLARTNGGTGVTSSNTCIQRQRTIFSTNTSGTTVMPLDNTVPQNTEGDQYMTLSITPANTSNILEIEADLQITAAGTINCVMGLFQDSTANALTNSVQVVSGSDHVTHIRLLYYMTAGTTSSTTFKIRAGRSSAGTLYVNTQTALALNNQCNSWLRITEWSA